MVNFEPWNRMLHQYVDREGHVNYSTWKAEAATDLEHWLNQLSGVNWQQDYPHLDQQLALWINLYNALVIRQVLRQYPISSIRPQVLGIPNWIAFFQFFSRSIYSLGDRSYSLNNIEHGTLRSQFTEPRIHFALVCAAIGCPLLRNEAYEPERVETQLNEDARRFINNPAKVRFDSTTQTLYCSRIFQWYRQDFLKTASSIPTYIKPFLAPTIPLTDSTLVRYLNYDWSLNQQI